jgi:dipeptidyl aminopeptidase/acylaminoacyl peptidase
MDISSDGKYLLFQVLDPKTVEDIWVCRIDSARNPVPFLATEFSENYPRFSPDGKWVVYTSNESGKEEVYVQSFSASGGRWQVSVNGGSQPRWRRDGSELFYVAPDLRLMAVEVKTEPTFDVGLAQPLFLTRIDSHDSPNRYVVAGNGQKFLINVPVGDEFANPITVTINPDL